MIIIIIIIILLGYHFKEKKHIFWNQQPVCKVFKAQGLITLQLPDAIINKNYNVIFNSDTYSIDYIELIQFLNNHFIKGYVYNLNFLKWILPNINSESVILRPLNNYNMSGCIFNIPTKIIINNTFIDTGYVDYLAVRKELRNNRLAPLLISSLVKNSRNSIFIFKIDDYPLPFKSIVSYHYYIYDFKNVREKKIKNILELIPLTTINYELAYNYYLDKSSVFKLYNYYDKESFKNYFTNITNCVNTLIEIKDNKVNSLISYATTYIKKNSRLIKLAEIICVLSENCISLIKSLFKKLQLENYDYLITSDIGLNKEFIYELGFIRGRKTFIQLYNYNISEKLKPENVLFNFI